MGFHEEADTSIVGSLFYVFLRLGVSNSVVKMWGKSYITDIDELCDYTDRISSESI